MPEEMVMRSVYLRPAEDSQLRQLAHELSVTKSDLIRSAIGVKLREWLASNSNELILSDLRFGQREGDVSGRTGGQKATVIGVAAKKAVVTKKPVRSRGPKAVASSKLQTGEKKKGAAPRERELELAEA